MRAWFFRAGDSLYATDEASREVIQKMQVGECAEFRILRPRSSQWNRMYWGLCRVIGDNQEPARSEDSIDAELRVIGGHYEVMHVRPCRGAPTVEVRVPKRIAFDKLTADEWAALWPSLELAIRERFGDEYIKEAA